jgi:hypothetical protein
VVSAHVSPSERKPAFLSGDRRERVQQIARRAGKPVEPGYHHDIAGGKFGDKPMQLGAVGLGSARNFPEHLARAGRAKLAGLSINALAPGRDARIAVNRGMGFRDVARPAVAGGCCGERVGLRHGIFMQRTYATRKPLMRQARPSVALVLISATVRERHRMAETL